MAASKGASLPDMSDKPAPEVEQAITKAREEGKSPSDAEKEANVAAGGLNDKALPPDASGAPIEEGIRQSQDMDHPAVDSQPRYGVSPDAAKIDFNDPS